MFETLVAIGLAYLGYKYVVNLANKNQPNKPKPTPKPKPAPKGNHSKR